MTKPAFLCMTDEDLTKIRSLQPEGWSDISLEFDQYLKWSFCHPIKAVLDNRIVGIGSAIYFKSTGWLAHIIVDKNSRNQGIGYQITLNLIEYLDNLGVESISLIATQMGKPVYLRAGFRLICEYCYYSRKDPVNDSSVSQNIFKYNPIYFNELTKLDIKATGEIREELLSGYLNSSFIYLDNGRLEGFYVPSLGEGPIIANSVSVGFELMKFKYREIDKAVITKQNVAGLGFLNDNAFSQIETQGFRMTLGKEIDWHPEMIFSRIGGNFG